MHLSLQAPNLLRKASLRKAIPTISWYWFGGILGYGDKEGRAHYRRQRPYRVECTGSLPNSKVNRRRARLVLGWGTAREDLRVLLAFRFSLLSHAGQHQPNTPRPPGNAQDHPPTTHTHTQTETRTHTHTLLPTLAQDRRK